MIEKIDDVRCQDLLNFMEGTFNIDEDQEKIHEMMETQK